eukprot:531928_1
MEIKDQIHHHYNYQLEPIQKIIIKKEVAEQVYIIISLMDTDTIEYTRIWNWNFIINQNILIFYLFKDIKDKKIYIALQIPPIVTPNDYEATVIDVASKQSLTRAIHIIIAGYGKKNAMDETQAVMVRKRCIDNVTYIRSVKG